MYKIELTSNDKWIRVTGIFLHCTGIFMEEIYKFKLEHVNNGFDLQRWINFIEADQASCREYY